MRKVWTAVIAALLLSNLVTGLISRTLPQINVLAIGLSIKNIIVSMSLFITSSLKMVTDIMVTSVVFVGNIYNQDRRKE